MGSEARKEIGYLGPFGGCAVFRGFRSKLGSHWRVLSRGVTRSDFQSSAERRPGEWWVRVSARTQVREWGWLIGTCGGNK